MAKYTFWIMLICFVAACKQPTKPSQQTIKGSKHLPADMIITPGGGIGTITLGENADSTISILGKPDKSDVAMGAQMLTWYDKPNGVTYQTNVYSHRNMGAADENISHIKAIRITSPGYNTADMLHAGMPFDSIKRHFNLSLARKTSAGLTVYTDAKTGIAFEVDSKNTCRAIIVFARGDQPVNYLNMGG